MKLSKAGEDLMHKYEGFRSRPYLCPAHIWTIGYGHVLYQEQIRLPVVRVEGKETPMIRKEMPLKPEDNRVWTKTEIDELFRDDVGVFERGVLRLVPGVVGRQGAFPQVLWRLLTQFFVFRLHFLLCSFYCILNNRLCIFIKYN